MSDLIGGSDTWSTWARVRCAVRQGALPGSGFHSVEYFVDGGFFKSLEGNGLLRGFNPTMSLTDDFGDFTFSAVNFVNPYPTKFEGETVTLTGPDSFTITDDAFTPPDFQTVVTTGGNPITDIGLLTTV
jgi:hypothetical protein